MKCFTWCLGEVTHGIKVAHTDIVVLGTEGMRRCEKVRCFPENPAEIVDGTIMEAHPVKGRSTTGESFYVLAKPENIDHEDERVLDHEDERVLVMPGAR